MFEITDGTEIVVDGERWLVRVASPGVYQFDWLSHRHGYGFSVTNSAGERFTDEQIISDIRDFLHQIDPTTGYPAD
ncbi:hypothetical protein OG921_26385 [Aldersonia sp. NBC_00410]|uniref:hypothetical protein n=1 Tax=Aldersonia sp. NBC_00410 TaxID=2975954 RepID=UPI002256A5E6|nr:hypothetical protein [Aldersonia sp. NBC_00410]MCX5046708.1 hypothetical protein [Aldersonia sp. NBC_00410]